MKRFPQITPRDGQSARLLKYVALVEGGLLLLALMWAFFQKLPLQAALRPTLPDCAIGAGAGGILLAANYAAVEYGSRWSAALRRMKALLDVEIIPMFRAMPVTAMIVIAALSGAGEELFFRGALQANVGIWIASLLFGAMHVWKKDALIYGVYAAVIGLIFGGLYLWRGSLWTPMLAHAVNNSARCFIMRITATARGRMKRIARRRSLNFSACRRQNYENDTTIFLPALRRIAPVFRLVWLRLVQKERAAERVIRHGGKRPKR